MRAAAIITVALCLGAWSAGAASAADRTVDIEDFAFEPATVTVGVGDTVTWENYPDGPEHTATADDGSFDTEVIAPGDEASVTFSSAGTFSYHCEIHPNMKGTVVVQASAPDTATDPAIDGGGGPSSPGSIPLLVLLGGALGLLAIRRLGSSS